MSSATTVLGSSTLFFSLDNRQGLAMTQNPSDSSAFGAADALAKPGVHLKWWSDYLDPESGYFYDTAIEFLVSRLGLPAGARVLDAGSGVGDFSIRLARHGLSVTAVDFSDTALAEARGRVDRAGLQRSIDLTKGDLTDLRFDSGTFDCVFCWGVLMHIPDVDKAIAELCRVVRNNGSVVISEANFRSLESRLFRGAKWLLRRTGGRVQRTDHGLEYWDKTPSGVLLTRQADPLGLARAFEDRGFETIERRAGELSESYARLPPGRLRRLVHTLNRFWFASVGLPGPAFGNIFVFRKPSGRRLDA